MAAAIHQRLALRDNYIHLVVCGATGAAALVDPSEPDSARELLAGVPGARLEQVWCTHHHWDHTGGIKAVVADHPGVEVIGSRYDIDNDRIPKATRAVEDGERFALGELQVDVRAIPGHTLGHTAFYLADDAAVFVGDTLFTGGCGRLFEGSPEQMTHSLFEVLGSLPGDTQVYCGHEYTESNLRFAVTAEPDNPDLKQRIRDTAEARAAGRSTVPASLDLELRTNPFLRCDGPAIRAFLGMPDAPRSACLGELRARKDRF